MKYFILRVEPYWYQVPGGLGIGAQLGSNTSGRGGCSRLDFFAHRVCYQQHRNNAPTMREPYFIS